MAPRAERPKEKQKMGERLQHAVLKEGKVAFNIHTALFTHKMCTRCPSRYCCSVRKSLLQIIQKVQGNKKKTRVGRLDGHKFG